LYRYTEAAAPTVKKFLPAQHNPALKVGLYTLNPVDP
jgi:hypothetical protein